MRKNFYELNYWKNHHINLGTSPRINLRIIQTFTSISPRIRKEFRSIRDCYQLFRAQPSTHLTETFRGCRNAHKTAEKQINGWICHHSTKSLTNIDYILIRQYCQVPLFSVFCRSNRSPFLAAISAPLHTERHPICQVKTGSLSDKWDAVQNDYFFFLKTRSLLPI